MGTSSESIDTKLLYLLSASANVLTAFFVLSFAAHLRSSSAYEVFSDSPLYCSRVCIWVCRNGFSSLQPGSILQLGTKWPYPMNCLCLPEGFMTFKFIIYNLSFFIYCMYIFFGLQKPLRLSLSWQMLVDFFKRAACRDEKSRANTGPIQWKFKRGAGYWIGSNKNCPGNNRFAKPARGFTEWF